MYNMHHCETYIIYYIYIYYLTTITEEVMKLRGSVRTCDKLEQGNRVEEMIEI